MKMLNCFVLFTNIGDAACPVESFLNNLSKLHLEREDLWQRPQ